MFVLTERVVSVKEQYKNKNNNEKNMTGGEYEKYFRDEKYFEDKYVEMEGRDRGMLIYANLQASSHELTARFKDCEIRVEKLLITNSLSGVLEGNPRLVSIWMVEKEIRQAPRQDGMSVKVIYPQWQTDSWCPLPPFRYEMEIHHYADKINATGDTDWYYLKLIWFDNAPAADISLADYINSITSQLDFFQLTSKMTEEEKDGWC